MTADAELAQLARHYGVFDAFTDMQGVEHRAEPPTQRALLRANGIEAETPAQVSERLREIAAASAVAPVAGDVIVTQGASHASPVAHACIWQVLSEADGAILAEGRAESALDLPELPEGVHGLRLTTARTEQQVNLIVAPSRVPGLTDVAGQDKCWGLMAAFYGLCRDPAVGLPDYRDLAHLAAIAGQQGAAFLGINPVHAIGVAARDTISPYSPTHRGFLNIDHIGVEGLRPSTLPQDTIDYMAHREVHRACLVAEFERFQASAGTGERSDFAAFCAHGGQQLEDFARFEATSLQHGPDSRRWPADASQATIPAEQLEYHKWLQWRADTQLGAAQARAVGSGMALGLYLDLAVGARLGGAESWGRETAAATGVSLGAPPDHLSPAGQNWQLAALSPLKLQQSKYEALRFVLRQNMRHCGLLRIDHALGLNRSFWLPEDGSPGGYIRQPFQALMAVIAIEARRAGTVIVGEDLGLVPEGFRDEMAARGLYGYSVLQYEKDARGDFLPADRLRAQSLACFGTHDTPTLEGFWQGRDIAWWEKLGWIKRAEAARASDRRITEKRQLAGLPAPAPLPARAGRGLRDTVHARLAASPAALVAVQLDDILCLREAQNLPGTVDEHPNWRRRYPVTLTQIENGPDLARTGRIMAQAGRTRTTRKETT